MIRNFQNETFQTLETLEYEIQRELNDLQQLKQKKEEKSQIIQGKSSYRNDSVKHPPKKSEEKKLLKVKSQKVFHDKSLQEYKIDPKPILCNNLKDDDDNLLENINDRTGLFEKAKDQYFFVKEESQRLHQQTHKNPKQNKKDQYHDHDNDIDHENRSKSFKNRLSSSFTNKTHRDLSVNETQAHNKNSTCNLKIQEEFTFTPKLSKKSLLMAKNMGKSRDRLTRESLLQVYKKREKLKENIENEFSFKPTINKKSEMLISRKIENDQKPKWEILHEHNKDKYEKFQKLKEQQEIEKLHDPNLTFKPHLKKSSLFFYGEDEGMKQIDRAYYWKSKLDERILNHKQEISQRSLIDCTFHPKTNNSVSPYHTLDEMKTQPSEFNKIGIIQHLERIDLAQRQKKIKEAIINKIDGKSWKYQITKPKEFKFSKENHEKSRNRKKSETTFYTKKIPLQNISKNLDTNHSMIKYCNDLDLNDAISKIHEELQNIDFKID